MQSLFAMVWIVVLGTLGLGLIAFGLWRGRAEVVVEAEAVRIHSLPKLVRKSGLQRRVRLSTEGGLVDVGADEVIALVPQAVPEPVLEDPSVRFARGSVPPPFGTTPAGPILRLVPPPAKPEPEVEITQSVDDGWDDDVPA